MEQKVYIVKEHFHSYPDSNSSSEILGVFTDKKVATEQFNELVNADIAHKKIPSEEREKYLEECLLADGTHYSSYNPKEVLYYEVEVVERILNKKSIIE